MADALCGPSNPLQNIQKHTSVDRTLQQDRLNRRQLPSQGFRSFPGPNAGVLDAEFENFQAGQPPTALPFDNGAFQNGGPAMFTGKHFSLQQPPDWAADFQRMNMNDTRFAPISPSQFRHEAPLRRSMPNTWYQENLRQPNPQQTYQRASQQSLDMTAFNNQQHIQPHFFLDGHGSQLPSVAQQKRPQHNSDDVFDEAAFERAFDAAKLEAQHVEKQQGANRRVHSDHLDETSRSDEALDSFDFDRFLQDTAVNYDAALPAGPDSLLEFENLSTGNFQENLENVYTATHDGDSRDRADLSPNSGIGADRILDEAIDENHEHRDEADELARTAGQLLDNLKHEQSQKFRESNFLALMRQLRDKEVSVEGNKIVDTSQPLHPGGQYYPTTADTTSRGALDNDEQDVVQNSAVT